MEKYGSFIVFISKNHCRAAMKSVIADGRVGSVQQTAEFMTPLSLFSYLASNATIPNNKERTTIVSRKRPSKSNRFHPCVRHACILPFPCTKNVPISVCVYTRSARSVLRVQVRQKRAAYACRKNLSTPAIIS